MAPFFDNLYQFFHYYLCYGFFGETLFALFSNGATMKKAIVIWLVITIIERVCLRCAGKKGGCLPYLGVLFVYVLLVGAFSLVIQIPFQPLVLLVTSGLNPDSASSKPRTPEQIKKDRRDALELEIYNSDELLSCLDSQEQARYIYEAQSLIYDDNVTPQEISSRLSHWEYYRHNPMPGSERYRQLYGDD